MKILNLQETYLLDITKALDSIQEQGFDAIQIDVLDYLEKNRKVYDRFSIAFDFSGVTLDVRDELGTKEELKTLCEEAKKIGISIIVKIKNTDYLGNAMHLLKRRINLLLRFKEEKHINLFDCESESEENFNKMLISLKNADSVLDVDECFNLYRTSMFSNTNIKELSSYLFELLGLGVGGFVLDDTLAKKTIIEDRLNVFLGNNRSFNYRVDHISDNLDEYYGVEDWNEEIMEARDEDSYVLSKKLSESVIFTPLRKAEYDSYWCTCYTNGKNSSYDINRFSNEYLYSNKIRQANTDYTLKKTD